MLDFPQNGTSHVHPPARTIRFGVFEADLYAGELRKAGHRIKVQEQPFKVLELLLERPGELVTREELQTRIWPDENFGDFDHAVNVAVGKLRTALGDAADSPNFVETVPRRGYRFIAKIENLSDMPHPIEVPIPEEPPVGIQPRRKPILLITLAVVAVGILVGSGVLIGHHLAKPQSPSFQRLTVRRGTIFVARFAPDGHNVIYSASWDGAPTEIFSTSSKFPGARSLGLTSTELLSVSSSGELAVLQSINMRFMLTAQGILGQVALTGGSPRQIAENVECADWGPDGKTLAVSRDLGSVHRIEFPLGHVLYETSGWSSHLRISPKGDQIAFLDHPTYRDDRGDVAVIDLSGHKKTLSTGWETAEGLAWSPDGKEIWFSAAKEGLERRIYAVDLSGHQRLVYRAPGGVTLQDIAPDGRVLLTRDEQRAGIMALAPGATKEQEVSWLDWSLPADLSADGNTLLFDEQGEESGPNYTVAIRNLRGDAPIPLGEGMAGGLSPDGKWAASVDGYNQLLLLPTGVGTTKRLDKGNIQQFTHGVQWLPDGKQIIFSGNLPGHAVRCFIQNVDGGGPRPVTPEGFAFCHVSPDGKLILGSDLRGHEVRLFPIDGGEPRQIPGLLPDEMFLWTSDPNFLYVFKWKQLPLRVYRLDIRNGQRQLFKELRPIDVSGLCDLDKVIFSADGRSYVYGYTQTFSELYQTTGLK